MREQLLYYAIKYNGDYRKISMAVLHEEAWKHVSYDGHYVTLLDDAYPSSLLVLKFKPWVLFYEGDLALVNTTMIGVVGSRAMSAYGAHCVQALVQWLPCHYGVVSGLAKGVDGRAHELALQQQRATIAVIGSGINVIYPKENAALYTKVIKDGLILSEYPKDTKPLAYHFPWRNRIIAGLCKSLVVVEAKVKSGTMISVAEALELGKDVYCFPHLFNDDNGEGCNQLIAQGSMMLNKTQDIKEI